METAMNFLKRLWSFFGKGVESEAGAEKFRSVTLKQEEEPQCVFCSNHIKTSKYTWWNFIPKSLFHLFRQIANFYFLMVAILQTVPAVSPLQPYSAWVPLLFVLSVSMIREASEDVRRHRSDATTNSQKARVRRNGEWTDVAWSDIQVGDVVVVNVRESIPADLILLHSSGSEGKCFIQTASLDGETNLKPRQVVAQTSKLAEGRLIGVHFETEEPRGSLEDFDARLVIPSVENSSEGPEMWPISIDNFLPREAYIRHVEWILGGVVFTGHDTRVMKGQAAPPQKLSAMDRMVNRLVVGMMCFQLFSCATLAILNNLWHNRNRDQTWYLPHGIFKFPLPDYGAITFWSFVLLMNTMIPISLLVSIEMVKFVQALFIGWDEKMVHEETDGTVVSKRWASWSTSTLNEELGQVRYVFSDKTGTLTTNMMEFRACIIGNTRYGLGGHERSSDKSFRTYSEDQRRASLLMAVEVTFDDTELLNDLADKENLRTPVQLTADLTISTQAQLLDHFLLGLSLCQDVTPEDDHNLLIYSGLSPDEVCLVDAARQLGYTFCKKTDEALTLHIRNIGTIEFPMLYIIKFTNSRKRSSVLVRDPRTNNVILYSKGADDVMFESMDSKSKVFHKKVDDAVNIYSRLGLRTLCIMMKILPEDYYQDWMKRCQKAASSLDVKQKERTLTELYTEIEKDCFLIGATGTEDKIQAGVPAVIEGLRRADISVWMITGDKLDTAVEIAKSCKLLDTDKMHVDIVDTPDKAETKKLMLALRRHEDKESAVVISGRSLEAVFKDEEATDLFFQHSICCNAAVVCRATKSQKAEVVSLIKGRMPEAITLAIGDGANDVPMLKEAHVGIGVFGKEGTQAVQNSDYAIAQFRFLERLLFVHGRWSYVRLSNLISYFFYKNIAYTIPQFLFGFYTAYSAKSFYDDWYIATYNFLFTSLPVLAMGMFEQDINPDAGGKQIAEHFPKFYAVGQKNLLFNRHVILRAWTQGFLHSIICFFFSVYGFGAIVDSSGHTPDFWFSSLLCYMTCVFVVTFNILIRMRHWSWIFLLTELVSVVVYMMWMMIYDLIDFNTAYLHAQSLVTVPGFWLTALLVVLVTSMPHFGYVAYIRWFHPSVIDAYQEIQCQQAREARVRTKKGVRVKEGSVAPSLEGSAWKAWPEGEKE